MTIIFENNSKLSQGISLFDDHTHRTGCDEPNIFYTAKSSQMSSELIRLNRERY